MAVACYEYSSASWLEDQDFWRLHGLFRSVELAARPHVHIENTQIEADWDPEAGTASLDAALTVLNAADAATVRGQKHLRELMDIVSSGERGAMFYLVQRPDGRCFGPAAFIDPAYAALFWQALRAGVEIYPYEGCLTEAGIGLGRLLPLAKPDCPDVSADFPDMTDSRRI